MPPIAEVIVDAIVRGAQDASARECNKLLGQTGRPFWRDERYDHLARNADEFQPIENYILQNPVRRSIHYILRTEKRNVAPLPSSDSTQIRPS